MADVVLCQEDTDDIGETEGELSAGEEGQEEEPLSPLENLRKYSSSDNVFDRQMAARSILDTLRVVQMADSHDEYTEVIDIFYRLSYDPEATVRVELMDSLPHIALLCHESWGMPKCILPVVVTYLHDSNNQVRKTCHQGLMLLLEHKLISPGELEFEVCPVIVQLANPDNVDEFKTEAATLIGRLAPVAGQEVTEKVFLPEFARMCTDALFHVRKVCATSFGDICAVVSQESTEEYLLQKFYYLCEDGVWGVRKACAECFMQVSCAVSPSIRRRDLAPLFISLICDQSRWVRMAAFQALGPFISTFADPASTGLIYYEDTGHLAEHNRSNAEKSPPPAAEQPAPSSDEKTQSGKTSSSSSSSSSQQQQQQQGEVEDMEVDDEEEEWERSGSQKEAREEEEAKLRGNLTMSAEEARVARMLAAAAADSKVAPPTTPSSGTEAEAIETFNAFNYWRTPIADLDLTAAAASDDGGEDRDDDDGSPALHMARLVSSGGDYDAIERGDGSTEASQTPAAAAAPPPTQMFSTLHMEPAGGAGGERDDSKGLQRNGVVPNAAAAGRVDPARLTNSPASSRAFHVETPNFFSGHIAGVDTNRLSYIDESESDNSFCDAAEKRGLSHDDGEVVPQQEQIPQSLLEKFTSMTQIILAQTVDTEIAKHCAYSLPAVAYTLGRCNWSCLKNTYETLASDMQWKVRRTLAFSNHELAVILGPDITAKDLVPIFNGFLKDLDEVRVGVLKHLFDFLKLLPAQQRREYLPRLQEFLNTDNHRNWRFRYDLAEQCLHLCQLFTPGEISEHIVPVAMVLASDKVSDVRCMSYKLLGVILRSLRNSENLMQGFVNDLIEGLALSYRWSGRHGFAMLCQYLLRDEVAGDDVYLERFAKDFLPSLLALSTDAVPNVRLALARALTQSVLPIEFMTSPKNPHCDDISRVLSLLRSDKDIDVQHYSSQPPGHCLPLPLLQPDPV